MKGSRAVGVVLDPVRESLISSSGGLLLREVIRVADVERALSDALVSWRADRARHDPGRVLIDPATAVALRGDCAADLALVRAQPGLFGPVASDAMVSRLIAALAADIEVSLPAIRSARARARARVWGRRRPLAGRAGRRAGGKVIVDMDSTLVTAHSDRNGPGRRLRKRSGSRRCSHSSTTVNRAPANRRRWICGRAPRHRATAPITSERVKLAV